MTFPPSLRVPTLLSSCCRRRPNPTHSPLQHTDSALCANRNGCRRKLIFLFAFLEHSLVAAAAMMVPELLYLHSPSLPVSSSSQRVVNMDTNDIPSPTRLIVLYSFSCYAPMYQQKQQQQQLSVIYTPSPRESSCGAVYVLNLVCCCPICAADNKGDPREHLHLNFCRPSPTQPANRQSIYPPIIPQSHGTSFTSIKLAGKALRPTKRTLTPFRCPSLVVRIDYISHQHKSVWLASWLAPSMVVQAKGGEHYRTVL